MKPRALDLCCGAGGMTKGLQRAGFYVVGVDINPQPNYCGDESDPSVLWIGGRLTVTVDDSALKP